jgi:sensor histidine kinase regulating citrate/malate metabolism
VLSSLLGQHYYQDGSYLYVVDRQRTLIYHPNPERIGQKIGKNRVVDAVLRGRMARKACSTPGAARCWQALPRWRTQAGG